MKKEIRREGGGGRGNERKKKIGGIKEGGLTLISPLISLKDGM